MCALDRLKERANKKGAELRKQREEKEGKEIELQKVRMEAVRTNGAIYIEPLA